MIKQVLIQEITASFGSSKGARFQSWVERWVDEQLKRGVIAGDDWVFLEQIGLDRVLAVTKNAIDNVNASTAEFFEWAWVLPVKDMSRNALTAMVEFRKGFFENHLARMGLNISEYGVIREDDIIHQTGSFEHICIDKDAGASGAIQAHFVNVVNTAGTKGSLVISIDELEHIKCGQIEFKYGGLDPLNEKEWQEFFECCLLRRFITSSLFDSLCDHDHAARKPLMHAINSHNALYTAGIREKQSEKEYHRDGGVTFKTRKVFSIMPTIKPEPSKKEAKEQSRDNVVPMERKNSPAETSGSLVKAVYADEVAGAKMTSFASASGENHVYADSSDGLSVMDSPSGVPLISNGDSIF